jgi:hypothetical protein
MNENRLFTRYRHNPLLLSLLSLKKGKTRAIFLDANLIRVAPEHRDAGGLDCLYRSAFGQKCILLEVLKECVKKEMLGMGVP